MFADPLFAEFHCQNRIIPHDINISALRFGDEAAERDGLLKQSFMPPRDLDLVRTGDKTIVLGDRGAGKSALFQALQDSTGLIASATDAAQPETIISACQSPAVFVQQMTADEAQTSSADGFKALWLLYSAALAARDINVDSHSNYNGAKVFIQDARTLAPDWLGRINKTRRAGIQMVGRRATLATREGDVQNRSGGGRAVSK